jgi:hypothetical protein
LYTARLAGAEQRLMAVAGDVSDLSWSPNGTTLAAVVSPEKSGTGAPYRILFARVSEDGRPGSAPRFVSTGPAWDLYWMQDSRSVLVLEQGGNTNTRVLRVPVAPGQQPVSVTPNEKRPFWDQYTSPDGRYVAIPVEQFGSSTLWRIDVDAAAKAWREKKGQR